MNLNKRLDPTLMTTYIKGGTISEGIFNLATSSKQRTKSLALNFSIYVWDSDLVHF